MDKNKFNDNGSKYIHDEVTHDMESPSVLVPIFIELLKPKNVCDVGCGVGNFLSTFKKLGVKKVLGYDGQWANKKLIAKHLDINEFRTIDFEKQLPNPDRKFDLVLCLEVAEHVSAGKSDQLIDFLTKLSKTVIFSAALPYQGGQNHINEQWEEYWEEKFYKRGYKKYDIIRHKIFTNRKIQWWYRQNIVVYSKKDLSHFPTVPLTNVITHDLYVIKMNANLQLRTFLNQITINRNS